MISWIEKPSPWNGFLKIRTDPSHDMHPYNLDVPPNGFRMRPTVGYEFACLFSL
ncbi:MAG TPA: hypothetical protein VFX43_15465 [Chitinophagaceae bacterium]|nr:hypothetical protein [Chitinophagaceae bacterium]